MFRLPTIFFVLNICIASVVCQDYCGPNSFYTDCGTACPLTCDNVQNPPENCIAVCRKGCFCNDGYVRNNNGMCVRPSECP